MKNIEKLFIGLNANVREAMEVVQDSGIGIAILLDETHCLIGTITDGDIRRYILHEGSLDSSVEELLTVKSGSTYEKPLSAHVKSEHLELMEIMRKAVIHQLPLIDDNGRVVDIVTMDDLLPEKIYPLKAVVMAGGFGRRLKPMTLDTPKTMLSVGDKPVMEHIISQLSETGIKHVNVSTHYMPEKIKEYFGDGSKFGVEMDYIPEDKPLGTAGGLGLMEKPEQTTLVINGDILSKVNYQAMLAFHKQHEADMTIGAREYDLQVPYGVIESEDVYVKKLEEKPMLKFFVNAGIYLLEPKVYSHIPKNEYFDMTDLINRLLENNMTVVNFPIVEYWLDIGKPEDFKQAQDDVANGILSDRA